MAQRQVSESVVWDIGSQVSALRDAGREPAEVRVSRTVKALVDRAFSSLRIDKKSEDALARLCDLGFVRVDDVPVVVVEGAAPAYWAVLPVPLVGAD